MLVADKLDILSGAIIKMRSLGLNDIPHPERGACLARTDAMRAAFDVVAKPTSMVVPAERGGGKFAYCSEDT